MKLLIVANFEKPKVRTALDAWRPWLEQRAQVLGVDKCGTNDLANTYADAILDYLPLFHAFAVYTAVLMSPATGARHILMPVFDAGEALRLIETERATMINGFDTHYKDLLEHPSRAARDVSSLRSGVCAAGMLSTEPMSASRGAGRAKRSQLFQRSKRPIETPNPLRSDAAATTSHPKLAPKR